MKKGIKRISIRECQFKGSERKKIEGNEEEREKNKCVH